MHQGDPPPGRRSHRDPTLPPLLLLALLALGAPGTRAAPAPDGPSLAPELAASLDRVESAFRGQDAERLRPVLPADSKVLIALESYGRSRRWYGFDQVVLLLREIFEEAEVIDFRIDRLRGALSGTNAYFVPASWSTQGRSAGVKRCRLQLMVIRDESGGRYRLREIKEVR